MVGERIQISKVATDTATHQAGSDGALIRLVYSTVTVPVHCQCASPTVLSSKALTSCPVPPCLYSPGVCIFPVAPPAHIASATYFICDFRAVHMWSAVALFVLSLVRGTTSAVVAFSYSAAYPQGCNVDSTSSSVKLTSGSKAYLCININGVVTSMYNVVVDQYTAISLVGCEWGGEGGGRRGGRGEGVHSRRRWGWGTPNLRASHVDRPARTPPLSFHSERCSPIKLGHHFTALVRTRSLYGDGRMDVCV